MRLFDLTDLRRSVGTMTDETGHFALPLRAFSTDRGTALPDGFALGQNYPNPFNPSTIIPYQIPVSAHVRLEVFNLLGQRLATLVDAEQSAGTYTAQWDATDAAGQAVGAGVYIYRLSIGGTMESRRMVLVDGQAGIPAAGAAPRPVWSVGAGSVKAAGSVYGLTVSGEGLVAYVNPAFRVGVDEADLVVEGHGGLPRMKLAAGGVLGDVDGNGQVNLFDVLYVLMYSEDSSIVLPNNGDISRGDVNGDGRVNIADAVLLLRYSSNPSDPALPSGIGEEIGDDHGNTRSEATQVFLGSSTSGTISDGDVDYFVVEMSGWGTLVAHTTSSTDTGGYILDSSGSILSYNDDGGEGLNFRVSTSFASAGTYYIRVHGLSSGTHTYTLRVQSIGLTTLRLTTDLGSDVLPAWSPDSKRIAFTSDRDGNDEIYVMNADGSNQTNLTRHDSGDWDSVWSPDGRRIAFTSIRDDNFEIYVMNADGSNQTNLTRNTSGDWSPAWSPDGQRIAFTSDRDGNFEIYVMDADGTNQTRLTRGNSFNLEPAWSPDGQRIAFMSDRDDGDTEIYVMDADGTNQTRLTRNTSDDWRPVWSPDGRRMAFTSGRDGNEEIYVMDADGTNQTRLTRGNSFNLEPVWSPDGRHIAFRSDRDGNDEIYLISSLP